MFRENHLGKQTSQLHTMNSDQVLQYRTRLAVKSDEIGFVSTYFSSWFGNLGKQLNMVTRHDRHHVSWESKLKEWMHWRSSQRFRLYTWSVPPPLRAASLGPLVTATPTTSRGQCFRLSPSQGLFWNPGMAPKAKKCHFLVFRSIVGNGD